MPDMVNTLLTVVINLILAKMFIYVWIKQEFYEKAPFFFLEIKELYAN